jgi:hypothetical protein
LASAAAPTPTAKPLNEEFLSAKKLTAANAFASDNCCNETSLKRAVAKTAGLLVLKDRLTSRHRPPARTRHARIFVAVDSHPAGRFRDLYHARIFVAVDSHPAGRFRDLYSRARRQQTLAVTAYPAYTRCRVTRKGNICARKHVR